MTFAAIKRDDILESHDAAHFQTKVKMIPSNDGSGLTRDESIE